MAKGNVADLTELLGTPHTQLLAHASRREIIERWRHDYNHLLATLESWCADAKRVRSDQAGANHTAPGGRNNRRTLFMNGRKLGGRPVGTISIVAGSVSIVRTILIVGLIQTLGHIQFSASTTVIQRKGGSLGEVRSSSFRSTERIPHCILHWKR